MFQEGAPPASPPQQATGCDVVGGVPSCDVEEARELRTQVAHWQEQVCMWRINYEAAKTRADLNGVHMRHLQAELSTAEIDLEMATRKVRAAEARISELEAVLDGAGLAGAVPDVKGERS
jgi:hypothetical protein